jgi:hypothetical protein
MFNYMGCSEEMVGEGVKKYALCSINVGLDLLLVPEK